MVQQVQTSGKVIVDYAFQKGLLLIVSLLAAALVYRLLVPRLAPPSRNSTPPEPGHRQRSFHDMKPQLIAVGLVATPDNLPVPIPWRHPVNL